MSNCTCPLSHPSYAGFIGNHSPLCPMSRDNYTSCTPDLLKQLPPAEPIAERFTDKEIEGTVSQAEGYFLDLHSMRLAKIIRQLQTDLATAYRLIDADTKAVEKLEADLALVKAECLPLLRKYKCELESDYNDSPPGLTCNWIKKRIEELNSVISKLEEAR